MSYIVEIQERNGGPWVANGVRFSTLEEAEFAKDDLAGRWFAPHAFRTVEDARPANYTWRDGEAWPIPGTMADNAQRPSEVGTIPGATL